MQQSKSTKSTGDTDYQQVQMDWKQYHSLILIRISSQKLIDRPTYRLDMGWRLNHRPYRDFQRLTKPTALGFAPGMHAFLDRLEDHFGRQPIQDWILRYDTVKSFYPSQYSNEFIWVSSWFTYSPFGTQYLFMKPDPLIDWSNPCPAELKGFMKQLNVEMQILFLTCLTCRVTKDDHAKSHSMTHGSQCSIWIDSLKSCTTSRTVISR